MRLGTIRPSDVVFIDRRGRRFYALVRAAAPDGLHVEPIDRRIIYRHVRAREVLEHFAKQGRGRGRGAGGEDAPIDGQLTLEHERQLAAEWDVT